MVRREEPKPVWEDEDVAEVEVEDDGWAETETLTEVEAQMPSVMDLVVEPVLVFATWGENINFNFCHERPPFLMKEVARKASTTRAKGEETMHWNVLPQEVERSGVKIVLPFKVKVPDICILEKFLP